jgi:hypothetical protein
MTYRGGINSLERMAASPSFLNMCSDLCEVMSSPQSPRPSLPCTAGADIDLGSPADD